MSVPEAVLLIGDRQIRIDAQNWFAGEWDPGNFVYGSDPVMDVVLSDPCSCAGVLVVNYPAYQALRLHQHIADRLDFMGLPFHVDHLAGAFGIMEFRVVKVLPANDLVLPASTG